MNDDKTNVQGEGDYAAAEAYNRATKEFVEAGKVERNNSNHDLNTDEQAELEEAEEIGKRRAKEEDPQLSRDYKKPQ